MDFQDFFRVIKVNLKLVISTIIISFLLASIFTFTATPIYSSNARLFVSIPGAALDVSSLATGSSFAESRVKSYAKIIDGPLTLGPVIKELKLPYSIDQLASMVQADAPLDTVLIDIIVDNPDANLAANIANAIAKQFELTASTLEFSSDGAVSPVKVSMVKFAIPNTSPSSPNKFANLLAGVIFGLGAGIGLALLRRLLDSTVKNETDLQDTPLLSAVLWDAEAEVSPLLTQADKYSVRVESFRQLRTNLQFISPEYPPKLIAVASALPGEGKTTTATNLAISLSVAGFKVLLLECDLRRPKVGKYLGFTTRSKGLTELLTSRTNAGYKTFVQEFYPSNSSKLKLDYISSGAIPPNPSELLNSERFSSLLKTMRKNYDYVIVDSPPILPVADTSLIATNVDGVLMVVHAGVTKKNQYLGAVESIRSVNSNVIGAVLNMIPPDSRRAQDYGYKYGYSGEYKSGYGYTYKYNYGKESELLAYAPVDETPRKIESAEIIFRVKSIFNRKSRR